MSESLKDIIVDFKLPTYNEIPDVGLFLEQTAKYVNSYLEPLGSVNLTTSMISNYVKKGIVANPVKKQYYRDQIAYIIFIAIAKTVLSLEDIQVMIEMVPQITDCETAYKFFCQEFEQSLRYVFDKGELQAVVNKTRKEATEKKLLKNTVMAVTHKIYLDSAFEAIRAEKKDEA